jgi:lysophospholipase L1-like esterase
VVDGGYLKMFKTIGVIGDSLSSGELEFKDNNGVLHYVDNYESSWLSNICRTIGATPIHYSEGGLTTKAWLQKYKTKLLNETNKPTCYFIALCTNDYGGVGGYGIGTIDDCYSDSAQTFIGYYGQIIRSIQTTQPKAKIFMLSSYARGTTQLQYSQAIEALSHKYSNTYYVDLYNLGSGLYDNNFYKNYGHFNDYGYVQVAKEIATICDKIIKDNYQSFKLATLIGTEFEQFIQLAQY